MSKVKFTEGPWEYVPSTEHHGPYVTNQWGGDICDCYAMSNPAALSVRNGGDSKPIHFQHEAADANARLIAAAPTLAFLLERARFTLKATNECLKLWNDGVGSPLDADAVIAEIDSCLAAATGEAA